MRSSGPPSGRTYAVTSLAIALVLAAGCSDAAAPDGDPGAAPAVVPDATAASAESDVAPEPPRPASWERPYTLDESVREFLWDMEHHANILGKHGFGAIKGALIAEDREALTALIAPDFHGRSVSETSPPTVRIENAVFTGRRWAVPEDGALQALDRAAFVGFLRDAWARFHEPPRIGFGVKHISPSEPHDLDRPWNVVCLMQLRGESAPGAPLELSCLLYLSVARPTKERMAEPGWLLGCKIKQIDATRAARYLFEPAEDKLGIDTEMLYDNWEHEQRWNVTGGVFACDFDRDACTDVLVTDVNGQGTVLLRGLPEGGFEDVTGAVGLSGLQRDHAELEVAFADLDGDGWEDLLRADGDVWRNVGGRRFTKMSEVSNLRLLLREDVPSGLSVADFDRDGRIDVFVARSGGIPDSWLEDTKDNPARNILLRNLGDWRFEDVTPQVGGDGGRRSVFNAIWLDADADGWPDVYVINEFGDGALYVNEEGRRLREVDIDPDTDDFGSMGAACGDVDNDGDVDIYVSSMYSKAGNRVLGNMPEGIYPPEVMQRLWRLIDGSELYCNDGDLDFTACGHDAQVYAVGWAWGASLADFDNDGLLDLYATAGYISRDRTKPDG